jgi:hypothetical protein
VHRETAPDDVVDGFRELVRTLVEDGDVEPQDAEALISKLVEWHNQQKISG